jgi:hypothetical protein
MAYIVVDCSAKDYNEGRMHTASPISVRLPESITVRLRQSSERTGVKSADLIRVALHQYLQNTPTPEAMIASVTEFRSATSKRRQPTNEPPARREF